MKRTARTIGLAALVGCGGGQAHLTQFSTDWQDDGGASIGRVWAETSSARATASANAVVGIDAEGARLLGLDLDTGRRWTFAHTLDRRPVIAGTLVVGDGGGELFAVAASDGHLVWKLPTGSLELIGAGDDGAATAVTLREHGETGSVLAVVARSGEVLERIQTEKSLGVPALFGHKAFVPWAGQYVSVFDPTSGDERARVTLRRQTSRAWIEGGALWFGDLSFVRFDEHVRESSAGGASTVDLPKRDLPGSPALMARGAVPLPTLANAQDRVRLYARPSAAAPGAALSDGRFYATYFRVSMGFDAAAKLGWVHMHDSDVLGGDAGPGGIVFCESDGKATTLDAATGNVLSTASLGEPVRACVVSVDDFNFPEAATAPTPLVEQLANAIATPDAQLVAAQRMLLTELAQRSEPSVTKALLDLASDPRTPPDLMKDARAALASRSDDASDLMAALHRRYDYLQDVLVPPPAGPIAEALARMKEADAAPLLAMHLLDPETPVQDLSLLVDAIGSLDAANEAPALRQFFAMYRANAEDPDLVAAVVRAGIVLRALHDKAGADQVSAAANDPMTVGDVREGLAMPGAP
jgi:outer membrane protein assembly factor BamB